MRDLVNNISKGKNLEVNLPKFGQEMMEVYYKYAAVRLAINHYTYNEMLNYRKGDTSDLVRNYNERKQHILQAIIYYFINKKAGGFI